MGGLDSEREHRHREGHAGAPGHEEGTATLPEHERQRSGEERPARGCGEGLGGPLVGLDPGLAGPGLDPVLVLLAVGRAIDARFQTWKLSEAEREVALLLLKGLSLREIASLRETSERTVRQQSLAVYRKAGLAGRAEL